MSETPHLKLPLLAPAQAQKHVTHNEALIALDEVIQLSVRDISVDTPPGSVSVGDRFIVSASPVNEFAGQALKIAVFRHDYWSFHTPADGWRAWVQSHDALFIFKRGEWAKLPSGGGEGTVTGADEFGINTSASAYNRLAVSSPASLFTHEGSDHRLSLNKASVADTGSVIFQTDYSGRAELGLPGTDSFSVRTSADGGAWLTRLTAHQGEKGISSPGFNSGKIPAPHGDIVEIPTPATGGFFAFYLTDEISPQLFHSGIILFDTGDTLFSQRVFRGKRVALKGTAALSSETISPNFTNLSVRPGVIQIANLQYTHEVMYSYTFLI